MSARITAAEARALLDGTTPGPWLVGVVVGFGEDSPDAIFDVAAVSTGVGEVWVRADARLIAAAPDLAATVITLTEDLDVEKMHHNVAAMDRDIADDRCRILRAERDAARAEVERLRDIVQGRTTPPTREECDAIVAEGGWWQCSTDDGEWGVSMCVDWDDVALVLRDAATEGVTLRWWAHDRTGRPCAWPTVGGAR